MRSTQVSLAIMTSIVAGSFALPWLTQAQSIQQPAGSPPTYQSGDNISTLLQGTTADQTKLGSFLIGEKNGSVLSRCTSSDTSGCSQLCINADPSLGATDSAACISTWSQLGSISSTGGPFVHNVSGVSTAIDAGYVGLRGTASSYSNYQLYTLAGEAYPGTMFVGNGALRTEAVSGTNYAAQFAGTLYITGPTDANGTTLYPGKLCLNDQSSSSGTCISAWGDVLASGNSIVRLQNVGSSAASADNGNVAAVGPLDVKSIVLGQPTGSLTRQYSCGDGICSSVNGESKALCPADCTI